MPGVPLTISPAARTEPQSTSSIGKIQARIMRMKAVDESKQASHKATCSAWIDHTGELPIIEGALIRVQVDRLLGGGDPLPL